jgi:hypothetical protein
MAIFEYVLVALLGSASAATPGGTPAGTFTADAVTQPSGGAEGLLGEATGGNADKHAGTGRKPRYRRGYWQRHYAQGRRHHKGHTRRK